MINYYSNNKYDRRKGSLILIKKYEYYEPIYSYKDTGRIIKINRLFFEQRKDRS